MRSINWIGKVWSGDTELMTGYLHPGYAKSLAQFGLIEMLAIVMAIAKATRRVRPNDP